MATKNNWFIPKIDDSKFKVYIKPYNFLNTNFFDACCNQAYELASRYNNLYIAYSGGLDSEFVLKVFKSCNLNITPILVETPYNLEEAGWAKSYCKDNNIELEVLTFGSDELIKELKIRTIDKSFNILLGGIPLIIADYIKERNGNLITGYGECFHENINKDNLFEFCAHDYYLNLYNNNHPAGFFGYSMEVLYSMIKELNYTLPIQEAKSKLYGLKSRNKMKPTKNFYEIQSSFIIKPQKNTQLIERNIFIKTLESYII